MNFPIIKIDIEGMRYQVVHALENHHKEVESKVDEEIANYIKNIDLKKHVAKITEEILSGALNKALKDYWFYGEGHEILTNYIKNVSCINNKQ